MTMMTRRTTAAFALLVGAVLGAAPRAHAQNLGPFRQFLSVEPYYENTLFDNGASSTSGPRYQDLSGVGARLWINAAPFVRSRTLAKSGVALFGETTFPKNGYRVTHYGAQLEQFFVNRPLGGVIDPVFSVGVGAYTYRRPVLGATVLDGSARQTNFALSPGLGLRLPIPNRLQLRFDARDAIVINQRTLLGDRKTGNNFEFLGAVGLTF